MELDLFTRSYIFTMLWAETGDDGKPLDYKYGIEDFAPEAVEQIVRECAKFQGENVADIASDRSLAGHDFWLTRNGHGSGFWDGNWPKDAGERLTEASKKAGGRYVYEGDDGKLYLGMV